MYSHRQLSSIRFMLYNEMKALLVFAYIGLMQKYPADFFSFLCFKFLLKQNTINQRRIYHCYL